MSARLRGKGWSALLALGAMLLTSGAQASMIPDGVDLWFSTSTPTISFNKGFRYLGPGAVLSTSGEVIASNRQLLAAFRPRLGLPLSRGLDCLAVIGTDADKTIVFSTSRSFYSNSLHQTISDGDLITNKGDVVATNQQLLGAFAPKGANFGLDGAIIRSIGGAEGPEVWFSTARDFYSQSLQTWISSGDILSNNGQIIARADDLLSAFDPRGNGSSIGLHSLYVSQEPMGQVFWFSPDKRFFSKGLNHWIEPSDLISSDGTLVLAKNEFMGNFGFLYPICAPLQLQSSTLAIPSNPPNRPPPRVPEPMTLSLLLLGGLGLTQRRR